jgi:hypothetical protein
MLEPQLYPELVAKALVLDDEPFVHMIEDDNPWVEGLALTTAVGLLAGAAQVIGAWLTANSLPDPQSLQNALLAGGRQLATVSNIPPEVVDALVGPAWNVFSASAGYTGGWTLVTPLIATPFLLILWWTFFAFVTYGGARAAGGRGNLNDTLGATALMVAPQVLLVFSMIPFVSVSGLLLSAWGLLIGYRAVQTTHELSWGRAALVTIVPYIVALLLAPLLAGAFALGVTAGGYR